jgi:pimeloyl-ACP methyl ester carboxylesterase
MPFEPHTGIYYELHGQGEPLFLGFPIFASHREMFGGRQAGVLHGFLAHLTDRYRVLVADYPSIGKSRSFEPEQLTVNRACEHMLAVADHAGFDRFAWWGYSVGAVVGLHLATDSDRLTALAMGGWSPLGGDYVSMARAAKVHVGNPPEHAKAVLRNDDQYRQWSTFWGSCVDWPEARLVPQIRCPRLAFAGADAVADGGGLVIAYAATLREHRAALESLGWDVRLIEGRGHDVGLDTQVVAPMLRGFLDASLPGERRQQAR